MTSHCVYCLVISASIILFYFCIVRQDCNKESQTDRNGSRAYGIYLCWVLHWSFCRIKLVSVAAEANVTNYQHPAIAVPTPLQTRWSSLFTWGHAYLPTYAYSVSERPRTTVPVGLLRPGRQCWHSAPSAFRQPSTTCSTSLTAQHLRPSGLFSCRPHSLELSPGFYPGPDHQWRLF